MMGLPILDHLLPQGILIGQNVQPHFQTFPRVPLELGMVVRILASHPLLSQISLDLFLK